MSSPLFKNILSEDQIREAKNSSKVVFIHPTYSTTIYADPYKIFDFNLQTKTVDIVHCNSGNRKTVPINCLTDINGRAYAISSMSSLESYINNPYYTIFPAFQTLNKLGLASNRLDAVSCECQLEIAHGSGINLIPQSGLAKGTRFGIGMDVEDYCKKGQRLFLTQFEKAIAASLDDYSCYNDTIHGPAMNVFDGNYSYDNSELVVQTTVNRHENNNGQTKCRWCGNDTKKFYGIISSWDGCVNKSCKHYGD